MKCDNCDKITNLLITVRFEEIVIDNDDGIERLLESQQNWCIDCINTQEKI